MSGGLVQNPLMLANAPSPLAMRAPNVGSRRMLSRAPAGYSRSLDRDSERFAVKAAPKDGPLFMARLRPSNTNQFGAVGVTQVGEIRSVRTDAGRVFD